MRIVRLSTENTNAIFDNNFNTDIILKPYSKVALQNLSLETEKESLVINDVNNTYSFDIGSSGTIQGNIPKQTYEFSDASLLLSNFEYDLNQRAGGTNPEIGIEWKVATNQANKVKIQYKRGLDNEHFNRLTTNNGLVSVDVSGSSPNHIFTSGIVDPSGTPFYECYMSLNDRYLALGGGRITTQIHNLSTDAGSDILNQGLIFGLSSVNPATLGVGADFDIANIAYGIFAPYKNGDYSYYYGGTEFVDGAVITVEVDSAGSPNNDSIEIAKEDGQFVFRVIKGIGTQELKRVNKLVPSAIELLYPVVLFSGFDASIQRFRATLSPFQNEDLKEPRDELVLNTTPLPQDLTPQTHVFDFGSISLANFLGFNNQRQPEEGVSPETINYELVANNEYEPIDVADSFIVEMLGNISLSSYDGLKSVRKSILAVIPESDNNTNGSVIFDANEKVFVDINNVNPITLRNVKTRVVKNDYSFLDIKGEATMTLIFKDENE